MGSFTVGRGILRRLARTGAYRRLVLPSVKQMFFMELVKHTRNYTNTTWLGHPIRQAVLDAWLIQEVLSAVRPSLVIETGTNEGGSALYYASLLDLLGHGQVATVDVEQLQVPSHPRVTYLVGSSTSPEVLSKLHPLVAAAAGPVMVILDSDHSYQHVAYELELYSGFVTPDSYLIVQDGSIDTSPIFQGLRPGPMRAIKNFLKDNHDFCVDDQLAGKFLITHHPMGWIKRLKADRA